MTTPDTESLDEQVRRADPERWLASRLIADAEARADVIALYAFDLELARAPLAATDPMMAEIRLTWWREAVDDLFAGKGARGHPALVALGRAIARRKLSAAPLEAIVEARFADIEPEAFADEAALAAYADGVAGAPLSLALAVLGHADASALRPAALAWTLARLAEAAPQRLPTGLDAAKARGRGRAALEEARQAVRALPVAAFPAVAHLALTGPRLKGRSPGPLEMQLRLTLASLTGRI